jgi:hypothetical protein
MQDTRQNEARQVSVGERARWRPGRSFELLISVLGSRGQVNRNEYTRSDRRQDRAEQE